jgi:hypothetical protein
MESKKFVVVVHDGPGKSCMASVRVVVGETSDGEGALSQVLVNGNEILKNGAGEKIFEVVARKIFGPGVRWKLSARLNPKSCGGLKGNWFHSLELYGYDQIPWWFGNRV